MLGKTLVVSNTKRLVSRFVPLLILCSLIVSFPKINMVEASGSIHIRADGSVEGTDKIHRDGNVYVFTGKISIDYGDYGIEVDRDNIVIDGAGFTLLGTAAYISRGIDLSGRSNVTIKNMEIRSFMDGIYLVPSSNNTITRNNITANTDSGIWTAGVSNNITGNYIANNEIGILFHGSHDLIYHNNFINNTKQVEDICWSNPWLPSSANILDDGYPSGGNYWSDYEDRYPNATELDDSGIWDTPYIIDANNQDRYPLMSPVVIPEFPDTTPPTIFVVSPENKTYTGNNVSLTFTVNKPTSWIGYSLDGQATVTIAGNTTLTGLSDGSHILRVYANDAFGYTGASEIVYFRIAQHSEPFPTTWIVIAIAIIVAVGVALLVYFRKIRRIE
ncbi:right-handed parallel beta-helix repeat-containing protein [Candidatus Bathyarchaeota archaeon]|nr:right-handed parallel beta-helix repeat-containing protein [Candidatus Bathyarchaeota archaeon]